MHLDGLNSPPYIKLSVGSTANAHFERDVTRKPKKTVGNLVMPVTAVEKK
jgi:hypothetical protein